MKKRAILYLALLCIVGTAWADSRSGQVLSRMGATFKEYKQYEVNFSLQAEPGAQSVEGKYIVSGEKYYLSVQGTEVFCDGKLKYEVSRENQEVVIDRVDPKDQGILANPTKVFDFPDNIFSHAYSGTATYGGKKCDVVTLAPKQKENAIQQITLTVDPATGLPAGISYKITDVSAPVSVGITSIKPLANVSATQFTFDKTKYKSFEIIDFR